MGELKKKKDDVWVEEDLKAGSGVVVKTKGDDRVEPKYDILLRQDLGAQDMYISLEVLDDRILVQAPKYRLNVALPHRVKKDDGKAEWEKLKATLKISLPIQQEKKYIKNIGEALSDPDIRR